MTDLTLPCGCELTDGEAHLCPAASRLFGAMLRAPLDSHGRRDSWNMLLEHVGEVHEAQFLRSQISFEARSFESSSRQAERGG